MGDLTTVQQLLKKRFEFVQTINTISIKHLKIIVMYISGMNPVEYAACKQAHEHVIKGIETLPMIENADFATISTLYENIKLMDDQIHVLLVMMANDTYTKMALYNMSATYTMSLRNERNNVLNAYERYQEVSIIDDIQIHNIVFDLAGLKEDPDRALFFISEHINVVNKFTIALVGMAIRLYNGEKRRKLELIVENQKDIVFGGKIQRYDTIVHHQLRSLTSSMTLSELLLLVKYKYNSIEQFGASHRVVFINNGSSSPIEFDMRGLIDANYVMANGLKTNPSNGLTKKVIERFNTAKLLSRGTQSHTVTVYTGADAITGAGAITGANASIKTNTHAHANTHAQTHAQTHAHTHAHTHANTSTGFYVVETLNGTLFRFLGNDFTVDYSTPATTISGLLNGISMRPHEYHKLISEDILAKCFDVKAQLILNEYTEDRKTIKSSEPIKNMIISSILTNFSKKLDKETTTNEIRSLLDRTTIDKIFYSALPHKTGIHGKGSSEYLVTYNVKFDTLVYKFIKEIDRAWDENIVTERVVKEKDSQSLHIYIIDAVRFILKKAADVLDGDNLWVDYDTSLKEYFLEMKQAIL